MGFINTEAATILGTLSDFVGVKSGLALNEQALLTLLGRDEHGRFDDYLALPEGAWVRIDSVVYEEMAEFLLYSVGRLERLNNLVPFAVVYHRYKHDKTALDLFNTISRSCIDFFNSVLADTSRPRGGAIDPTPFLRACRERHGSEGLRIAHDVLTAIAIQQEISSAYSPAGSDWDDVAQLEDLFRSEGLDTQYGRFFDQRYIDYLHRNFDDIDRMNWRKFEGITGEYFDRQGFNVEVGPGRNDDGVDVRVWPAHETLECPPAIIVQCKRQQERVSRVIVKSLYADVLHAGAASGLIVTTSQLAPGARTVLKVRDYPIREADRDTVRQWVSEMRKPGLGTAT